MKFNDLSSEHLKLIKLFQKFEITEYHIYRRLAKREKGENQKVLQRISEDEIRHFNEWKKYSNVTVKPNRLKIFFYLFISKLFGVTFGVKMLEKGEQKAESAYGTIVAIIPEVQSIIDDEMEHEQLLLNMIDEEKLGYISSMVLGLNDALVELTGALAGFTLALQNVKIIGLAGLITGIAASLSMAASEYLSVKSEEGAKNPLKAAFYTGIAYVFAVLFLVLPFFFLANYYLALLTTLAIAVLIIFVFSYFVAVVKETSFRKFFWEMVLISLSVAAISFFIGWLARVLLKVDV